MISHLFDPSHYRNIVDNDDAEVFSDKQMQETVYRAASRLHDENVPLVFQTMYIHDFLIRLAKQFCRFEVVPMEYACLEKRLIYPSPLPAKELWSKEELARVMSEFPPNRGQLALAYNALYASDLRSCGHSFAVPAREGFVVIHIIAYSNVQEQEVVASSNPQDWPGEDELEDIRESLSMLGWRMPKGWTFHRVNPLRS